MWRAFIELHATEALWRRRPWRTWRLTPAESARIALVTSATDWARLVLSHHVRVGAWLCPDWIQIAARYEAVHFSPLAICAVEGFRLNTPLGAIPPVYWTVESTLWLSWCFDETVGLATDC